MKKKLKINDVVVFELSGELTIGYMCNILSDYIVINYSEYNVRKNHIRTCSNVTYIGTL